MKKTKDFLITRVTVCLSAIHLVSFGHNTFFRTKEYIFIISLPLLLHEKCPDFFLLTQRQQEAHLSVYDDVVPGDYSDSSCGIFSEKKENHFSSCFPFIHLQFQRFPILISAMTP
jgi:hypothetical protein